MAPRRGVLFGTLRYEKLEREAEAERVRPNESEGHASSANTTNPNGIPSSSPGWRSEATLPRETGHKNPQP
jgi:hypothetical protein